MKHALLRTLPGRAIVLGAAVKAAVFAAGLSRSVPAVLRVSDTVASVALAIGGGYFLVRGLAFAKRRLLWRVRRKLIISYIFIGFIPSLLIVAFFLLGGLFLFSNFSSYMVQNRFGALADRASSIATAAAVEVQSADGRGTAAILARRQSGLEKEFPGISFAVVPMEHACSGELTVDSQQSTVNSQLSGSASQQSRGANRLGRAGVQPVVATAGPWEHVAPPDGVPDWLADCKPFAGLFTFGTDGANGSRRLDLESNNGVLGVLVRALGFPDATNARYAVVVDIVGDEPLTAKLRADTGVEVLTFRPRSGDVHPLPARHAAQVPRSNVESTLPLTSFTFLEQRDWTTGARGSVMATLRISVGEIYSRISTQAFGDQRFSQGLLIVLVVIGVLFLIIQAVAFVAGLALARSITGSVHALFAGTERVRQGDFTHKIDIKVRDQLGELAASFNSMTDSIEDLLRDAAEKKRLEEELRIAHEIQMSLLPHGPLSIPGLSITALCVPAREVGGDYYDVLPLDDGRVGVLIADVSGKGTSAALYMAELKGLVLSLSRIHTSPRDLLIDANRIIANHLDARSFITMTYAVIDLHLRTMTYARAGHTPLIYLPGGPGADRRLRVLAPDGLVLGLKIDNGELFERLLKEETIAIHSGDLYLFFTDGITEAMNEGDDCFGETRLAHLVEEHAHLPSDQLRERVLREIEAFVGRAPQHDDMTMILLRIEDVPATATVNAELADVIS
jgi:serine phosphatase RsbU (regulator of sigma subunit)